MEMTESKIAELKTMVTAAREEFRMAVTYHEVWKPAGYNKELHRTNRTKHRDGR